MAKNVFVIVHQLASYLTTKLTIDDSQCVHAVAVFLSSDEPEHKHFQKSLHVFKKGVTF